MTPPTIVGVVIGPGGIRDKTYFVINSDKFLGESKASSVNVRKTAESISPTKSCGPERLVHLVTQICQDQQLPAKVIIGAFRRPKNTHLVKNANKSGKLRRNKPRLLKEYVEAIVLDPYDASILMMKTNRKKSGAKKTPTCLGLRLVKYCGT